MVQPNRKPGSLRLISGQYRGRMLQLAESPGLRPTPSRVRATLFNWLQHSGLQHSDSQHGERRHSRLFPLERLYCLDLFAGSGVLGFEAASRGAQRVLMLEKEPAALAMLRQNQRALGAQAVEICATDVWGWLRTPPNDPARQTFDLAFLDPPFAQALDQLPTLLGTLACHWLRPHALLYLELPTWQIPPGWHTLRQQRAGAVHYGLITRAV